MGKGFIVKWGTNQKKRGVIIMKGPRIDIQYAAKHLGLQFRKVDGLQLLMPAADDDVIHVVALIPDVAQGLPETWEGYPVKVHHPDVQGWVSRDPAHHDAHPGLGGSLGRLYRCWIYGTSAQLRAMLVGGPPVLIQVEKKYVDALQVYLAELGYKFEEV